MVLLRQGRSMTAPVAEARPERTLRPVLMTVDDDPSVSRAVAPLRCRLPDHARRLR